MAVASLVLGIVSLVFIFIPGIGVIGILTSIVGIVLGVLARKQEDDKKKMATAGMVCSIVALGVCVIVTIACAACIGVAAAGSSLYKGF